MSLYVISNYVPVSSVICFIAEKEVTLSMHAICGIVYTTKTHSLTSYCFKVFFLGDVALVYKYLNRFLCLFYI